MPIKIPCLTFESSLLQEIREKVAALKLRYNITPKLATVLVGDDPSSQIYVKTKSCVATKVGMMADNYNLSAHSSQKDIVSLISQLNEDKSVNGILLQLPLPKSVDNPVDTIGIINTINPNKDVDGLTSFNLGLLASHSLEAIVPCTPLGVSYVLKQVVGDLSGKHVVVVGRSTLVGLPAALLALGQNATITICHSKTDNLKSHCLQADVLVVAVGRPNFIDGNYIKPGAVVIDVGINRVEDASTPKGYSIVGDVKWDESMPNGVKVTPVPKGIGKMTVACLMCNTYKATLRQNGLTDDSYNSFVTKTK